MMELGDGVGKQMSPPGLRQRKRQRVASSYSVIVVSCRVFPCGMLNELKEQRA